MIRLLRISKNARESTKNENKFFQTNINLKVNSMKGKIFPESNNIYQDQAKILFNYYQQMAEKIVQEEERIEKEIAKLQKEKETLNLDLSKARLWKWVLC